LRKGILVDSILLDSFTPHLHRLLIGQVIPGGHLRSVEPQVSRLPVSQRICWYAGHCSGAAGTSSGVG
jgi:hypothetical protein